jgi:hypothetical protein
LVRSKLFHVAKGERRADKSRRNCEGLRQTADSSGAAYFLGRYDESLCADLRHMWQAVAAWREQLHDSNTLDDKFPIGMRLD